MNRNHCIRCGECCLSSSPTLHGSDRILVMTGALNPQNLYTIRRGEMVFNNLEEKMQVSDTEMIKVGEGDEGGCIYYDQPAKGCRVYEHRPSQCAALKCWDRSEFDKVFSSSKLERKDIVTNSLLWGLIQEHERRCAYGEMDKLVKRIESAGEKALEDILTRLRFDYELRPFVSQKLNLNQGEMDLYFGRPLIQTIVMYGLEIRREQDGGFLLTKKEG